MIRKIAKPLFPVLLSCLLAACAGGGDGGLSASQGGRSAVTGGADADAGTETDTGRATAAAMPNSRQLQNRHAGEFVGSSRQELVAWLGQPDLELREDGRSLLQFRQGQCVMLAMVGDSDSVAAVETSGVVRGADARCAGATFPRVMTQ